MKTCQDSDELDKDKENIFQAYIEGGAAGVHYEDQLGSEKKCGHMGGKVGKPLNPAIKNEFPGPDPDRSAYPPSECG